MPRARELAQGEFISSPAHILGLHNFIGFAEFEDTVLMNAGLMGKSIGPTILFGLHRKPVIPETSREVGTIYWVSIEFPPGTHPCGF